MPIIERTINTENWIRGLILNILNTRARSDLKCPNPAAVYGHWSESYREDGFYIGSTLWNAAEKKYIRTADAVKAIAAAVRADVSKLIMLGVIDSVDVEAAYRGRNAVEVIVKTTKKQSQYVLSLSGTMTTDSWAWN